MRVKNYEYTIPDEEYQITDERKKELIEKVQEQVRKGFIAHHQILSIGKNDYEYSFIYEWLDENKIKIRGIDRNISDEINNYIYISRKIKSDVPERLDEEEQNKLLVELSRMKKAEEPINLEVYFNLRNKLVEHNMGLAIWFLNKTQIKRINLPQEDKEQIAMEALIHAVEGFRPELGFKFSSYAAKAIYRAILSQCFKDIDSRYSVTTYEQLSMLPEIEEESIKKLGRKPTEHEIADILGITVSRVLELFALKELRDRDSLEKMQYERSNLETVVDSLLDGEKISFDEENYIKDGVYLDEDEIVPLGFRNIDMTEHEVIVNSCKNYLEQALQTLPDRYAEIIRRRFGFYGAPQTCVQVANFFGISDRRVNYIEHQALMLLRHPSRIDIIKDYMDINNDNNVR